MLKDGNILEFVGREQVLSETQNESKISITSFEEQVVNSFIKMAEHS